MFGIIFVIFMFVVARTAKIMYKQYKAEKEFWNGVNEAMKAREEEMKYAGFHA